MRFRLVLDRKRALISRLMQKRLCQMVLDQEDFELLQMRKTKGKKPFLHAPRPAAHPNFNYNVSHEGRYVVCASEVLCVCGVDVAASREARQEAIFDTAFLRDFRNQLTTREWDIVKSQPPEDQYEMFQRFWSCKEAVVKARGDGLVFELNRIELDVDVTEREKDIEINCKIDNLTQPRWRLYQTKLPHKHWVTVARAPIEDVQDQYKEFLGTLAIRNFTEKEWEAALTAPAPEWSPVDIPFLLPPRIKEHYKRMFLDPTNEHGWNINDKKKVG